MQVAGYEQVVVADFAPCPAGDVGDRERSFRSLRADALEFLRMIIEPPVERIVEVVAGLWPDQCRVTGHRGLPERRVGMVEEGTVRVDTEQHRPILLGEPIGADTMEQLPRMAEGRPGRPPVAGRAWKLHTRNLTPPISTSA
jgi:hypothetical protein